MNIKWQTHIIIMTYLLCRGVLLFFNQKRTRVCFGAWNSSVIEFRVVKPLKRPWPQRVPWNPPVNWYYITAQTSHAFLFLRKPSVTRGGEILKWIEVAPKEKTTTGGEKTKQKRTWQQLHSVSRNNDLKVSLWGMLRWVLIQEGVVFCIVGPISKR